MVDAQWFGSGSSEGVSISFDTLTLCFPTSNEWSDAVWELRSGNSIRHLPAASTESIAGVGERFDVRVVDGRGPVHGPFSVQTVLCGYPNFTLCFLFHADAEGFWSGHTVAKSFGAIVVVPYRADPA